MEGFRRLIKGWLGRVLLGFVVFVFALFGAESLMTLATRPKPAAEVNGVEISRQQLDARVEQEARVQRSRMGEHVNEDALSSDVLAPKVLNDMVLRLVLNQRVMALGFGVSDLGIKKMITGLPQLQDNGKFSKEKFDVMLQRSGLSPQVFLKEVSNDYMLQQLTRGIAESYFLTDQELNRLVSLQDQERVFEFVALKPEMFTSDVSLDDKAIEDYYAEHSDEYRTVERAKFDYVILKADLFANDAAVSDEALRAAYDAEVEKLQGDEQRHVSHILIKPASDLAETQENKAEKDEADAAQTQEDPALTKIKEIKKQLDAGADFAELAKKFSEDPGSAKNGGELGFAGRGVMVEPFEKAIFSMKVGEISDVVKTQFGYHVIKLKEIKKPEIPAFDERRDSLMVELKQEQNREAFTNAMDELNRLAYESGDLAPIAEKFELSLKVSDWVERTTGTGVFANPAILKAAFSNEVLKDGFNSDAVVIGKDQAVVLRLNHYSPSEDQPLTAVKDSVKQALMNELAHKVAVKRGQEIVASLRAGEALTAVNEKFKLTWETPEKAKRLSTVAPREVMQKVFQMPRPESDRANYDGVELAKGFAVIVLKNVETGESDLSDDERFNMRLFLAQQLGSRDVERYLDYHKAHTDIKVNL